MKKYRVDDFKKSLGQLVFPNYKLSDDVTAVYSDLFQNFMTVIGNVVPLKTKRVKGNTN